MKNPIPYLFLIFLLFSSCAKIKKTEAEKEREAWIQSFTDSIEYYENLKKQIVDKLNEDNKRLSDLFSDFDKINNPREVTGYYLLKGWNNKIPLTSTGIYARMNENEELELIATLTGGTFNHIGVGTGDKEVFSEIMPHDQAFNYRHPGYNTVYFSGGKADTIAQYIADHVNDKVVLQFIEGKNKRNFILPENEKNIISKTYNLISLQRQSKELQKELWISSKKVESFRRMTDSQNQISDK